MPPPPRLLHRARFHASASVPFGRQFRRHLIYFLYLKRRHATRMRMMIEIDTNAGGRCGMPCATERFTDAFRKYHCIMLAAIGFARRYDGTATPACHARRHHYQIYGPSHSPAKVADVAVPPSLSPSRPPPRPPACNEKTINDVDGRRLFLITGIAMPSATPAQTAHYAWRHCRISRCRRCHARLAFSRIHFAKSCSPAGMTPTMTRSSASYIGRYRRRSRPTKDAVTRRRRCRKIARLMPSPAVRFSPAFEASPHACRRRTCRAHYCRMAHSADMPLAPE